ncbi:hypothetical protein STRIP9103_08953, partial [Streptomyces ipomoeae 91-03]
PSGEQKWLRLRGRLLPGDEGRPVRLVGTVADASTMRSGLNDVARIQRLAAALATAGTVRDVSQAVVTALRAPLQADRIALAELEGDRLVVTVLDPPQPEAWPEVWRSEWRSEWPDAPVRTMPTLAAALRDGRAAIWPAGTPLEPALADVGPGGLAVLPLPAGGRMAGACLIGWDGPHEFGTDERALLTAAAGLAGQACCAPTPSTPSTNWSTCSSAPSSHAACPSSPARSPSPAICPPPPVWRSAATGTT